MAETNCKRWHATPVLLMKLVTQVNKSITEFCRKTYKLDKININEIIREKRWNPSMNF